MFAIIKLQLAAIAVLSVPAYLAAGAPAFWSLLLGGLCYAVPTLLAVLVLNLLKKKPALAGAGFLLAEGLKTVLALLLMVAVFALYREIRFVPFFIGLLGASHFVFLLLLRVHRHGK